MGKSALSTRPRLRLATSLKTLGLLLAGVVLYTLFAGNDSPSHRRIASLDDSQCAPVLEGGADAISCHIALAQRKFDRLISSQSKTFEQAHDRYVAQYKRQPPPGFDAWFAFAQQNNAPIIDDYGQLEADLLPLRSIAPHVLRQRIKSAMDLGLGQLHTWSFANGNVTTTGSDKAMPFTFMYDIMAPFLAQANLPPFTVLENSDDSHRVCGPRDGVEDVNDPVVVKMFTPGNKPDAKAHLTYGCPRSTAVDSYVSSDRPSIDVCTQADDWTNKHGILHNKNRCINGSVPLLSLTKVSSYQDITFACGCYGNERYRLTDGDNVDKIAYADKKPHLYWRGSNTGWTQTGDHTGWMNHRHRLVMAAHQMNHKAADLLPLKTSFTSDDAKRISLPNMPSSFTPLQLSALSRLTPSTFDIQMVHVAPCNKDNSSNFCQQWMKTFPAGPRLPSSAAFGNKFVMDVDGHSMSCRFYRLLDSNSLVFKQTIYVEWHDDRVVPWLHYVPVSMGMEELPLLVDYFANHETGKVMGEKLAEASKQWASTGLRKADLSVYTYRQMLELAHIIGHD